jgi:uncharacterized protein
MKRLFEAFLRRVITVLVIVPLSVMLFLLLFQVRLILPAVSTKGHAAPAPPGVEEKYIRTSDGENLRLWKSAGSGLFEGRKMAAAVFPGNGDTLGTLIHTMERFAGLGFSTYGFEYRGTGGSSGWPSEKGLFNDVLAVSDYITKSENFAARDLLLVGTSFGTGMASRASRDLPGSGLVLVSPYLSIADVVRDRGWMGVLSPFVRINPSNKEFLPQSVSRCVVIAHGTNDEVVPFYHGAFLRQLVPPESRFMFIPIAGANHWDILGRAFPQIEAFLHGCFGTQSL